MTRKEAIKKLYQAYKENGIKKNIIAMLVDTSRKNGIDYDSTYVVLRMAMGEAFGKEEQFTAEEISKTFGIPINTVISKLKQAGVI